MELNELCCFILLVFIIHLGKTNGLECKSGMQIITATGASHEEDIQAELCTLENRYCVTVTCQMAKMEFTQWACYPHNNKAMCIEYHTTKMKEKFKNENIRCNCKFGKANEEMANDPLFKGALKCLDGSYDYKGYGAVGENECKKDDEFCYVASCKTDSESDMYWGCVESKNCEAIAAEISMYSRKNLTCQCGFGEENVEMGNENLTIPIWEPPINIEFTEIEINACRSSIRLSVPFRISLVMMAVFWLLPNCYAIPVYRLISQQ